MGARVVNTITFKNKGNVTNDIVVKKSGCGRRVCVNLKKKRQFTATMPPVLVPLSQLFIVTVGYKENICSTQQCPERCMDR